MGIAQRSRTEPSQNPRNKPIFHFDGAPFSKTGELNAPDPSRSRVLSTSGPEKRSFARNTQKNPRLIIGQSEHESSLHRIRTCRGLGSRLIHEAGTVTGEARTLGVFLGSSARSARFSDRASRAPLLSGPFDLFFRLAFPSGVFIRPFFYRTRPAPQTHPPM